MNTLSLETFFDRAQTCGWLQPLRARHVTNVFNAMVYPKAFDDRSFVDIRRESCLVPPNSFALARSMEYLRIPRDVLTLCVGKSTYAH